MLEIIKARLARGADMKPGEIRLILNEILPIIEQMERDIEELKTQLAAKPRGGGRGAKGGDSKPPVQD